MPREWSDQFRSSTRGRIVSRLRHGPATVEELAAAVGLTDNGVRVHLATLERDGWIHGRGVRRSETPGKPATLYGLAPDADALLSTAYRPLLLALLSALADRESPAHLATLLRDAGRRLAAEHHGGSSKPARQRIAELLASLGAEVDVVELKKGR